MASEGSRKSLMSSTFCVINFNPPVLYIMAQQFDGVFVGLAFVDQNLKVFLENRKNFDIFIMLLLRFG